MPHKHHTDIYPLFPSFKHCFIITHHYRYTFNKGVVPTLNKLYNKIEEYGGLYAILSMVVFQTPFVIFDKVFPFFERSEMEVVRELWVMFRGLLLYTAVVIFHIYWCTRKPRFSSIILYNSVIKSQLSY